MLLGRQVFLSIICPDILSNMALRLILRSMSSHLSKVLLSKLEVTWKHTGKRQLRHMHPWLNHRVELLVVLITSDRYMRRQSILRLEMAVKR